MTRKPTPLKSYTRELERLRAVARLDARGRPRKDGARYPSGKLVPTHDAGTPELAALKQSLAGPKSKQKPSIGDPRMTTQPLDILRTRGLITEPQWQAGVRFQELRRGYPWPHAKCIGMEPSVRGQTAESDAERKAAERYQRAGKHLRETCRPAIVSAVVNVVVTQAWGAVTLAVESVPARAKLAKLRVGLTALAEHFGIGGRRAA